MRSKLSFSSVAAIVAATAVLARVALWLGARRRSMKLRGKVAVVCGASRGLGLALARVLADRGCKLAICARTEADLAAARDELMRRGAVDVYAQRCDLRRADEVDRFLASVSIKLGPIDLLVANAATLTVGPIEALDVADFEESMSAIFGTALHAALGVIPSMRARGEGTIAFVTSIGGKIGVPHLAPYSAAKFAEVGLAQALRAELAKDGIHVLSVVPGLMRTGSYVHARFKGDAEKEVAWFGASANAPVLSIDTDRAARRIVSAIERGASEVTYTPAARIAARLHDVAPELVSTALRIAGRLLPRAKGVPTTAAREGLEVERPSAVRSRRHEYALRHGQLRGGV